MHIEHKACSIDLRDRKISRGHPESTRQYNVQMILACFIII